jgi:D-alanyl-lipoteichoic acid acyltransferase DltB (MBOAT superfamily)
MSTALRTATELHGSPSAYSGITPVTATLSPSSQTASDRNLRQYLLIVGQLAVLIGLSHQFQLEGESFRQLLLLTVGGFAVHYFLPIDRRLPFFVLLSFAGIGVVLGPRAGAWLIGLGLGLIGICHLPVRMSARVAMLGLVGAGLATLRFGIGEVPWSSAVWPILGSMFALRLIVYLYDRSHETAPPRLSQTLGYFFLLPNVCFPLFPVVDFKKFTRHYYDSERHTIYQVGVEWIWRALLQLILYRIISYQLTLDPVAVGDLGQLLVYMLSTYLMYVRISGHFHLIVGMLHLFGFNLPETHHRYLLASSFTDFWRRINIYWKDFMMKVFYYPAFFRLRRFGDTKALVLATAYTFLATWFLHIVQWFWIRRSFLLQWNDVIFWVVLGSLVIVNSLYETRRRRTRAVTRTRSLRESTGLVFSTIGTFTVICVLWTFWTAESVSDWRLMMRAASVVPAWRPLDIALVCAALLAATALAIFVTSKGWGAADQRPVVRTAPATIVATAAVLCLLTLPGVAQHVGGTDLVGSLQATSLSRRDAEEYQRGYYENLLDVGRFNRELQHVYEKTPRDFARSLPNLGLSRRTNDEQDFELVPERAGRFIGAMVRTNRWGMRDRDYALAHPPGVYRIALLGPSTAMGAGVEADQSFEALLEDHLNREAARNRPADDPSRGPSAFEILNFGVAGYSPLHVLYQFERKVRAFEPDMTMFVGHASDIAETSRWWARMVKNGVLPRTPFNADLLRRSGLTPDAGPNEARRRMKPFEEELLRRVYGQLVAESRQRGSTPVFVYMERVTDPADVEAALQRDRMLGLASAAGFAVLDLSGVFHHRGAEPLWIAEHDIHPNALGNRLLADTLYTLLMERRTELGLDRRRDSARSAETP